MAPRLSVLLLQLPVPNNPAANLPLAAGYLKAWATHEGLAEQVEIAILPRDVADRGGDALLADAIVARQPDVLGLSLYTWNSERSLAIAAQARARLPRLRVVVGGPEVQTDNDWVLRHPAVDVAVLGEGEQTFVALLRAWLAPGEPILEAIEGLAFREGERLIQTPARAGLDDLSAIPSPYLLGYLELRPGEMALVECSRWCPYRCTFCLYGRNMGTKLGRRYFPAERVAAEVAWAQARGAGAVHFVEANLNLLPYFRELMPRLQALNPDRQLKLYAELRGEHLGDEAVDALVAAGLHAAEVGLQSANPEALLAVERRTDLAKWAAGTRRLYARNVEVFLDVILGLPLDNRETILQTLRWIEEQQLGPYDIFTLQVLPGTPLRGDATRWQLDYQDRPPYYVLRTDQLSYAELRALRWELREQAGFDPQAVEGMPEPLFDGRPLRLDPPSNGTDFLNHRGTERTEVFIKGCTDFLNHGGTEDTEAFIYSNPARPIELIEVDCAAALDWEALGQRLARQVASHLTLVVHRPDLEFVRRLCWPIAEDNPTIHWDLVLLGAPPPRQLRALQAAWPHAVGYLDRVAVYRQPQPEPPWAKATPRLFVLGSLESALDPLAYEGLAELLWLLDQPAGEPVLEALLDRAARRGGAGVVLPQHLRQHPAVEAWRQQTGWRVWESVIL